MGIAHLNGHLVAPVSRPAEHRQHPFAADLEVCSTGFIILKVCLNSADRFYDATAAGIRHRPWHGTWKVLECSRVHFGSN